MSQDHQIATPLRRVTKAEACQLLQVSLFTLDRRIAAGQLAVERVQPKGYLSSYYIQCASLSLD